MKSFKTPEEKHAFLTEQPVSRVILTLAVPTIFSMLISSFYNMADTYFVGTIGTVETAAVGVAFPLMTILQALGFTFGHGSGNFISRALGRQELEDARKMATCGFVYALIFGALFGLAGLIFIQPLVKLLGATPVLVEHTQFYVFYILLGAPFMTASLVMNNQLRFQGSAFYGMVGMVSGAVLNIALDPLFIFTFKMGVAGAALATLISQIVSFFILLRGMTKGGNIAINLKEFTPRLSFIKEILRGGIPSLLRQGLQSVATIALNFAAGPFGEAAIAAMSIVGRVMFFANSAVIGLGQGFQPVCGFNYGAGLYERVRKAFYFTLILSTGALLLFSVVGLVFAPQLISLFRADDAHVISIGATALRLQCIVFPFSAFVVCSNMMLQTIGKPVQASLAAASRSGLFFLPAILLLPSLCDILGVQLSQPIADVLSLLLVVPLTLRELSIMQKSQLTPTRVD